MGNFDILIPYLDLREKYKQTSVRSRKSSDLYKTNSSLKEKLAQLRELMDKASKINIKPQQGLSNMMVSLKSKQALLTGIVACYQGIVNEIKVSGVIAKLKKRGQQVTSKSASKKKIERGNESIQCCNQMLEFENCMVGIFSEVKTQKY